MTVKSFAILFALILLAQCSVINKFTQFKSYAQQFNKKYQTKFHELYRFAMYLQNL